MKTDDSESITADKTRCLEYSEKVRIFKPLIVQNLLVHDILPSLPFLDNHDDIYCELKNRSEKSAVLILLDELENCQELGKWDKFINALSDNGYSYIVDNIRGYKFINHFYQREYIKNITPKIGSMITVCEIISFVYAKKLISESDKEHIQKEDANRGNFAAAVLLLDRIHRKHRNWYLLFIEALNEAGMDEVAKCLEIPALLESKRTKNFELYKQCDESKGEKMVTQRKRLPLPPVRAGNSDEKYDYAYSANAHVIDKQQDTDEYTYDDTVQSTYNIPPLTNSLETENSIQSDSEYEQYELNAPPIPPRLPWSSERRDLKIQKADSAGSKQTEIIADFDNPLVKFVNPSENVRLMNENEELKKANNVLVVQISLLEQKSSMIADINENINIRRDLLEDIALKEKENNALIAGPVESDDLETNEEANDYYPSSRTNERAEDTHADTFAPIKQTFDYRDPILYEEKCFPCIGSETYIPGHGSHFTLDPTSIVSIYDVNFYNRNKIVAMFDKDSGIGMN
ncbi:uncharacterized protein LOC132749769 [Ruditapes philippinarum]|uniref:uncharacterized protein LOC132749769 n=1 Tax=Ruditapes philippinarum TaxID=129788 RepID=UPI00295BFADB|nr:uncharacterized protein LOC132749769 [Ruditapes philippinarum]